MFFLHNSLLGAKFWKVYQNCFLWAKKIILRGKNYRKRSFFHHSWIWRKNVALLLKRSREVSQNCIQSVLRILLKENISFENLFYRFRCLKKKLLNFCEGYRLPNPKRDLCAQRKVLRNGSIIFFNNVVFMQTFAVLSAKSSSKAVRAKVYVSSGTLQREKDILIRSIIYTIISGSQWIFFHCLMEKFQLGCHNFIEIARRKTLEEFNKKRRTLVIAFWLWVKNFWIFDENLSNFSSIVAMTTHYVSRGRFWGEQFLQKKYFSITFIFGVRTAKFWTKAALFWQVFQLLSTWP